MTPNNLAIYIQLEALISEREGMIAENKRRESVGHSMAYDDNAFNYNAQDMRKLLSKVQADD